MRYRLAVPIALLLFSACASPGARGSSTRQDRNVITEDEISHSSEHNVYNLIRAVRPGMLTTRGRTSITNQDPGIVVFMNGQRFGDISSLEGVETSTVHEIRYLTAAQAQSRFGTGYPQGVIAVTTRTR